MIIQKFPLDIPISEMQQDGEGVQDTMRVMSNVQHYLAAG
jgi:hypothetical protein